MKMRTICCGILTTFALAGCSDMDDAGYEESSELLSHGVSQKDVDRLASSLEVQFSVIENVPEVCPDNAPWGLCLDAKITIRNRGARLTSGKWAIYYSSIRQVLGTSSSEFTITHINGDLHKIEPTAEFTGFHPGQTKEIALQAEYWMLSETDVMPRFYVAAPGRKPATIRSTDTETLSDFVTPFTQPEQTRRHPDDLSVIATAGTRFEENASIRDLGADAVASQVVPTPQNMSLGSGSLNLARGVTLNVSGLSQGALTTVTKRLQKMGVSIKSSRGVPINVSVNPNDAAFAGKSTAEAYRLSVDRNGITIVGGDAAGAFYGLQTLIALVPVDCGAPSIRHLTIDYDAPRYGYRGVQVDLARNFHGVDSIMKVLDQMAAYKLNTLHLHLTDDEGWRLEIPGLPELTDVGGSRCHDLEDQHCLMTQLGAGPTPTTSGTGYLTRNQFVQVLRAARDRSIEVIPEFDMPGHARAAIKSMEARARNGDPNYLLSDPDDNSQYLSVQRYKDNAINGCLESTYAFIGKVMDEVKAMYAQAGATLTTWHVGGDEVGAGAWTASPACDALYASGGEVQSADDVHAYFVRRTNELAMARGIGIRGWSDGMRKTVLDDDGNPTKVFLDPIADLGGNAVSTNWWGTLFWWDNSAYTLANMNYDVVLTSPDFLYLDHPYEADPKERGYYWATRFTNMKKLFAYIPGNLPANSQLSVDRMGYDYTAAFDGVIELNRPANIIGMEAPLWSETVRTPEQLEYMMFPRILAVAERAWHRSEWEPADGNDVAAPIDLDALDADWERFANTLGYKELRKLDRAGIRYRIEVPGARIVNGRLEANIATPGLTIQYRNPGGVWKTYNPRKPQKIKGKTQVRAITSTGRAGRAVDVP